MKCANMALKVAIGLAFVISGATAAAFPGEMSFQGQITDSSGNPVPNSDYEVVFKIFPALEGGTALWQETNVVITDNGRFEVVLGRQTPIPSQLFMTYDYDKVYLEMTVQGEILAPRTQLVASPYSMVAGDLEGFSDDNGVISFRTDSDGHRFDMFDDAELVKITLDSRPGGEVRLYGTGPTNPLVVELTSEATLVGGAALRLWRNDGTGPNIELYGEVSGDSAAMLPPNAINELELLNEPGIANTQIDSGGIKAAPAPNWSEIASVTIHLPTAGYVFVSANAQFQNFACPQGLICSGGISYGITDTIPGSILNPGSSARNLSIPDASDNSGFQVHMSTQATYQKEAGTWTFYFVAQDPSNFGSDWQIRQPTVTAMFFPTAYGIVDSN